MKPRHHPSEAWLMDYAAGTLGAARDLVIGAHVASCDVCARDVGLFETVGGALLDEATPPIGSGGALLNEATPPTVA